MGAIAKIEWNLPGFTQILRSQAVFDDLAARAQRIADAAGDGFEPHTSVYPTRAASIVVAATYAARRAESVDKVLTKAIDAGR